MNIVYISGCKYKSFYLNYFKKIGKCDLLIFNYGIFYDYNINNKSSINIVIQEIKMLANCLRCTVLAGINLISKHSKQKCLMLWKDDKCEIKTLNQGVNFLVQGVEFFACGIKAKCYFKNKIVFCSTKIKPNLICCNKHKTYLFCDALGISFVRRKNLKRKFNKCSKIILK